MSDNEFELPRRSKPAKGNEELVSAEARKNQADLMKAAKRGKVSANKAKAKAADAETAENHAAGDRAQTESEEKALRKKKRRDVNRKNEKSEAVTESTAQDENAQKRAELQAKEAKRNQRMMEMRKRQGLAVPEAKPVKKRPETPESAETAKEEMPVRTKKSAVKPESGKASVRDGKRVPRTEEEKRRQAEIRRRKMVQERRAKQGENGQASEGLSPEEIERRRMRRAKIAAKRAAAEQAVAERTAEEIAEADNLELLRLAEASAAAKAEKRAAEAAAAAEARSLTDEADSDKGEAGPEKSAESSAAEVDRDESDKALSAKEESGKSESEPEDAAEQSSEQETAEQPVGADEEEPVEKSESEESNAAEEEASEEAEDDEEDDEDFLVTPAFLIEQRTKKADSEAQQKLEQKAEKEKLQQEKKEKREQKKREKQEKKEQKKLEKQRELTPEEKKERKEKRKKRIRIAGTAAGAAVLVYAAGTFYFMNHFYPNTTLNGLNVSCRSISGVKHVLKSGAKNYEVTLIEKDGTEETLTGSQLGLYVDWDKDAVKALMMKQHGYDWIARLFQSQELKTENLMIKGDVAKAAEFIYDLPCMDDAKQNESQSAKIVKDYATTSFVIQDEVAGTAVDPEQLAERLIDYANTLDETFDLEGEKAYKDAEVTADSDELHEKLAKMNSFLEASITYDLGDTKSEVLDKNVFFDWIYIDEDLDVHVDEDKVIQYVDYFADKYDDFGTGKNFYTSYGYTVYIPNSNYGWKLDKANEVAAIINDIRGGEPVAREAYYDIHANSHDDGPWGNTYVEVSLTAQHVWLYVDGECVVSTDCVTGCEANGNGTHTGIFFIFQHFAGTWLTGENYKQWVDYWMAFNGGEGLHDASWRYAFGGDIYYYSGSHGCVNLPTWAAAEIFNYTYYGFPVIVYSDYQIVG